MNTISTDPSLLGVDLPRTLIESPSVSTFLAEEEASICPLLSNTNGTTTPLTFSHPLTPCADNDSNASDNLVNSDAKAETSSSSGSSSGIGMDLPDSASATLFIKHAYQHLQNNNGTVQDANGHGPNGSISKDAPSFVSWNWPLLRKCTFFVFMSSIFGMCAIVIAMMVNLPKTCNPKTAWYRGGVFYEIFPANFQDSNHDGVGDINGITNSVVFLASMGITAVRLNSIFPSLHYPDDYEKTISITELADVLGDLNDMRRLADSLHERNISLILDIPLNSQSRELENLKPPELSARTEHFNATDSFGQLKVGHFVSDNLVSDALRRWIALGVDGFFLKCYEKCTDDADIATKLAEWKEIVGKNRVLIVSEAFMDSIEESHQDYALLNIDLVHVHLDINNGTKYLEERIKTVLTGKLAPKDDGTWIHWSIGDSEEHRFGHMAESSNVTLAATLMQLMLPGSPSIFYGDQIALAGASNQYNEPSETKRLHHLSVMQWINTMLHFSRHATVTRYPEIPAYNFKNFKIIAEMIELRDRSPSIYKNSICKMDKILTNTQIRRSHNDILIIERIFPRRNTIVSISNFGSKTVTMDMTSMYYSGVKMLQNAQNEKVYFSKFEIGPFETIVVKLDK